jgi:hypothetical protein
MVVRQINLVDPFGPFASQPAADMVKKLLLSDEVQGIRFTVGSVLVWPAGFRAVADQIHSIAGIPGLRVVIDPTYFIGLLAKGEAAFAEYDAVDDTIRLPSHRFLESAVGLGIVVHECVHALSDLRGRSTAVRSEEGAADVAAAWYYLACGVEGEVGSDIMDEETFEIAAAVRERAARTSGIIGLGASEINAVRRTAARDGADNGHTIRNGIAGVTL